MHHLRTTAERHDLKLDASFLGEQRQSDMLGAANVRHPPIQGLVLRRLDQIVKRFIRAVGRHRDQRGIIHGTSHADDVIDRERRFAPGYCV